MRIGFASDIHRLVPERKLILAGVHVPYDLGEEAHSDGDVVYHAVAESILGALALGDLGKHFPDTDPKYKDMHSSIIVRHVVSLIQQFQFSRSIFVSLNGLFNPYVSKSIPSDTAAKLETPKR